MSRMYKKGGEMIPVSLIKAEDCYISQIKDDKYKVIQIVFNKTKKKDGRIISCLKKANIKGNFDKFIEFRVDDLTKYKLGDKINISEFKVGDKVNVVGISKGKGFAGVMKRHGFHGADHSHGHKHDWRSGGSIGAAFPEHVFKGVKMPGRMGGERVTAKCLEIVDVCEEDKVLAIKGGVPGFNRAWLEIASR